MSEIRSIAVNSFFRAIIEITKIVGGMAVVIIPARLLGAGEFGRVSFALALMAFFAVGLNLGLPLTFIREGAKDQDYLRRNIAAAIVLQGLAAALLMTVLTTGLLLFPSLRQDGPLLVITFLYTIFSALTIFLSSYFQAVQRMHFEAYVTAFQYITTTLLIALFIFVHKSAESVMWSYLLAGALSAFLAMALIRRHLFSWSWRFEWGTVKTIFQISWPLTLALAFGTVYNFLDSVMLRFMRGNEEVGIYNALYKIVYIFYIFSSWYLYSIFPQLSQWFSNSRQQFQFMLERSLQHMGAFYFLFGLSVTFLAPQIISILYGPSYLSGTLTLQILIWSSMTAMVSGVFYLTLVAIGQQKSILTAVIASAIANTVLNFILIPKWGMNGAAISTVIAQLVNVGVNFTYLRRITRVPLFRLLKTSTLVALFAVAIYGLLHFFVPSVWAGIGSVFVYTVGIIYLKVLDPAELKRIAQLLLQGKFTQPPQSQ